MSDFNRFRPRIDTYTNWETINNNTPGGLKIMQGEICVIIADAGSAAAGLSNIIADMSTPLTERLANTGEVMGMKYGNGYILRWDEIPTNYHIPNINFANGSGRVLGTRNNGATHVYNHPGKMFKAIFKPVYTMPGLNVSLTSSGNNINGALYEVGQSVSEVNVNVQPLLQSYRIKLGRAFEITRGRVQLGADETATDPNTIGSFSRPVANFLINPTTGVYDAGSGTYGRQFIAEVTDAQPSAEGGETTTGSGTLYARATYPTFFGKSTQAPPSDPAQLGTWLQANTTAMIRGRDNYPIGNVAYSGGEHAIYAHPAAWGPLARINNINTLNELETGGSFSSGPVNATITKTAFYNDIPYLVYVSGGSGFNATIFLSFLF
jgi:hypothetical protein